MDEKVFELKEKFKIDDSHSKVRGIVCAYDENGNLLFEKENMIVESGRKYIMKHGINENSFSYAFLSENSNFVMPGDTIDSIGNMIPTIEEKIELGDDLDLDNIESYKNYLDNLGLDNKENYKNYFGAKFDYDNLVVKCLIIFNDERSITANSLGLVVNDGEDNILFSRLTIPTYLKSINQRIIFKYYIYF